MVRKPRERIASPPGAHDPSRRVAAAAPAPKPTRSAAASFNTSACGTPKSCERRLGGNGGEGAAELKVAGRTIKESGFDRLFQQVDGLSDVDSIALFAPAALGLAASCKDAWPLRSSSSCCS